MNEIIEEHHQALADWAQDAIDDLGAYAVLGMLASLEFSILRSATDQAIAEGDVVSATGSTDWQ